MKVSDYIVRFLAQQGVNHVFQLIGGAITHLVDSTIDCEEMLCITMHHEQGAAFAAEGYARCNGKLGVAMATSGPGATNLITGIGSCYFDSVPTLFITGQVNSYEYKYDAPVRQIGFQETDIVSLIKPITKGAKLVDKAEEIPEALQWAIKLAQSGRPGPVLLDIPMNIQRADIPVDLDDFQTVEKVKTSIDISMLDKIIEYLMHARRPLVLLGGGVRAANACEELLKFLRKTKIPAVTSLMGVDALAHSEPTHVGMIGAYGNRYANIAVANADCLIILGSRLDTRQTGTRPNTFARNAKIIHIDIDPFEINRAVKAEFFVEADVKDFLQALNQRINKFELPHCQEWHAYIDTLKKRYPSFPLAYEENVIDPNAFLYQLSQHVTGDAIIVLDVGQHQMWAAQSFFIQSKQRMLISGGMGSMGFALPAAIGAAFANPQREIIVIAGDGGFQMNIQELQTIMRNHLKIKIVLLNNQSLGMVRQFQQLYFNGRTLGTLEGYDCPDFSKVVAAYGLKTLSISEESSVTSAIKEFCVAEDAFFLEVHLPTQSRVEPKLVVNHPIEDQDPKISREELQEVMLIPLLEDY